MDTRNYCVECDMPKPCECPPLKTDGIMPKYWMDKLHPNKEWLNETKQR